MAQKTVDEIFNFHDTTQLQEIENAMDIWNRLKTSRDPEDRKIAAENYGLLSNLCTEFRKNAESAVGQAIAEHKAGRRTLNSAGVADIEKWRAENYKTASIAKIRLATGLSMMDPSLSLLQQPDTFENQDKQFGIGMLHTCKSALGVCAAALLVEMGAHTALASTATTLVTMAFAVNPVFGVAALVAAGAGVAMLARKILKPFINKRIAQERTMMNFQKLNSAKGENLTIDQMLAEIKEELKNGGPQQAPPPGSQSGQQPGQQPGGGDQQQQQQQQQQQPESKEAGGAADPKKKGHKKDVNDQLLTVEGAIIGANQAFLALDDDVNFTTSRQILKSINNDSKNSQNIVNNLNASITDFGSSVIKHEQQAQKMKAELNTLMKKLEDLKEAAHTAQTAIKQNTPLLATDPEARGFFAKLASLNSPLFSKFSDIKSFGTYVSEAKQLLTEAQAISKQLESYENSITKQKEYVKLSTCPAETSKLNTAINELVALRKSNPDPDRLNKIKKHLQTYDEVMAIFDGIASRNKEFGSEVAQEYGQYKDLIQGARDFVKRHEPKQEEQEVASAFEDIEEPAPKPKTDKKPEGGPGGKTDSQIQAFIENFNDLILTIKIFPKVIHIQQLHVQKCTEAYSKINFEGTQMSLEETTKVKAMMSFVKALNEQHKDRESFISHLGSNGVLRSVISDVSQYTDPKTGKMVKDTKIEAILDELIEQKAPAKAENHQPEGKPAGEPKQDGKKQTAPENQNKETSEEENEARRFISHLEFYTEQLLSPADGVRGTNLQEKRQTIYTVITDKSIDFQKYHAAGKIDQNTYDRCQLIYNVLQKIYDQCIKTNLEKSQPHEQDAMAIIYQACIQTGEKDEIGIRLGKLKEESREKALKSLGDLGEQPVEANPEKKQDDPIWAFANQLNEMTTDYVTLKGDQLKKQRQTKIDDWNKQIATLRENHKLTPEQEKLLIYVETYLKQLVLVVDKQKGRFNLDLSTTRDKNRFENIRANAIEGTAKKLGNNDSATEQKIQEELNILLDIEEQQQS